MLTPVEQHGGFLVKRDDLYSYAGVSGGKVRTCRAIAEPLAAAGVRGLVTAGARHSPQANIVAHVARHLGLGCRVHTAWAGSPSAELLAAAAAGAVVVEHRPGYNSVIVARAEADALDRGWGLVPFGMECSEAITATAGQLANLPWGTFDRIVIPVGSGMSMAGVLRGLVTAAQVVPVLGVVVGADPGRRLRLYAPPPWRYDTYVTIGAGLPYSSAAPTHHLGNLELDPIYEGKCLPFLEPGDLLWVVGIREPADLTLAQ